MKGIEIMELKAGDLVRLRNLRGRGSIGLITRVRPCRFSGTESIRIYKVTWFITKTSIEYAERQLVKA
tara:strand:- start:1 stop:204 length:204 start_codon:yes stop_codon:yes gene_type:complete